MGSVETGTSVADVLAAPIDHPVAAARHLWADEALQGGLTLALLVRALRSVVPRGTLTDVTAQFHRPVRGPFVLNRSGVRHGIASTAAAATAWSARGAIASAHGLFANAAPSPRAQVNAPDVPPPESHHVGETDQHDVMTTPNVEVRPLRSDGPGRSLAWTRLVGEVRPPDVARLAVLLGLRAPGDAMTVVAGQPLATAFRPHTAGLSAAASPWVLLETRATVTSAGWIEHRVRAWDPDGNHLGAARHLGLARATTD